MKVGICTIFEARNSLYRLHKTAELDSPFLRATPLLKVAMDFLDNCSISNL